MTPSIIAITSFYNPSASKMRLKNFKEFRRMLGIELITVELSFNGVFELNEKDSDYLIQIKKGARVWQKEKLINIALNQLPKNITAVAWIDADIIFENNDWHKEAIEALREFKLIQLYTEVNELPGDPSLGSKLHVASDTNLTGIVHQVNAGNPRAFLHELSTKGRTTVMCGMAWAAQKDFIQKHGLYDACITGSGDRALVFSAYGRFYEVIDHLHMNPARQKHFLAWAENFHHNLQGRIGNIPGIINHLWHGDTQHRGFGSRHQKFATYQFDPSLDLMTNQDGVWDWREDRPDLMQYFNAFFRDRCEP